MLGITGNHRGKVTAKVTQPGDVTPWPRLCPLLCTLTTLLIGPWVGMNKHTKKGNFKDAFRLKSPLLARLDLALASLPTLSHIPLSFQGVPSGIVHSQPPLLYSSVLYSFPESVPTTEAGPPAFLLPFLHPTAVFPLVPASLHQLCRRRNWRTPGPGHSQSGIRATADTVSGTSCGMHP